MRKRLTVWIVLTGLLSLSAAEWLDAQPPNASTKFRGDFGRPSMRSTPPRTVRNVQVPAVASASDAAIESYSLEPLPFGVGDTVTVVRDRANLLRGKRVVGSVGEGSELRVLKIRGPWVGTVASVDGRDLGGWVWYSHVAPLPVD
ncbi:MAG: hypothetical protein MUF48_12930 [Pirellulaceae bacterium]|jgi:hypothetical protein|nr:hypothetical protein [Pirellulaceae bacterium]